MKLVNISSNEFFPNFVNPEQVDAVIADDMDTIVYAGQYMYRVRKHYTKVLEMLGVETEVENNE